MKSYEETISIVLERAEQYRIRQKQKKKIILSVTIPICLIAMCVSGFYILQGIPEKQSKNVENTPVTLDSAPIINKNTESTSIQSEITDKIIINQLGNIDASRMDIALMIDDFIPMTLENITEYYGTNIIPEIPADLTNWDNESYGIYKRNGGTGEIYYDQNIENFSNEGYTRNIYVEAAKGRLPFHCCVIYDPVTESSIITGVEVAIGLNEYGQYGVWFIYQNTGFYIFAEGITEEELISVIKSLTR